MTPSLRAYSPGSRWRKAMPSPMWCWMHGTSCEATMLALTDDVSPHEREARDKALEAADPVRAFIEKALRDPSLCNTVLVKFRRKVRALLRDANQCHCHSYR